MDSNCEIRYESYRWSWDSVDPGSLAALGCLTSSCMRRLGGGYLSAGDLGIRTSPSFRKRPILNYCRINAIDSLSLGQAVIMRLKHVPIRLKKFSRLYVRTYRT